MRLIYTRGPRKGQEVQVGHAVKVDGEDMAVSYFRPPHKPASQGKVSMQYRDGTTVEWYVSVIGAEWVGREDRVELPMSGNASDADRGHVRA